MIQVPKTDNKLKYLQRISEPDIVHCMSAHYNNLLYIYISINTSHICVLSNTNSNVSVE